MRKLVTPLEKVLLETLEDLRREIPTDDVRRTKYRNFQVDYEHDFVRHNVATDGRHLNGARVSGPFVGIGLAILGIAAFTTLLIRLMRAYLPALPDSELVPATAVLIATALSLLVLGVAVRQAPAIRRLWHVFLFGNDMTTVSVSEQPSEGSGDEDSEKPRSIP